MNKSELIDHIATQADISKAAAGRALEALITGVKATLKKGNSVSLVGFGTAKIEAINPKTKKAEATLKVTVLKEQRVRIAIRPVKVRDDQGILVNSSQKPINPDVLVRQMNRIWKPQANVVFELSKTDPVTLDGLRPERMHEGVGRGHQLETAHHPAVGRPRGSRVDVLVR